jgi:hypothetical protein
MLADPTACAGPIQPVSVVKNEMRRIEDMLWSTNDAQIWAKLFSIKVMVDDMSRELTLLALATTNPEVKRDVLSAAVYFTDAPYSLNSAIKRLDK